MKWNDMARGAMKYELWGSQTKFGKITAETFKASFTSVFLNFINVGS